MKAKAAILVFLCFVIACGKAKTPADVLNSYAELLVQLEEAPVEEAIARLEEFKNTNSKYSIAGNIEEKLAELRIKREKQIWTDPKTKLTWQTAPTGTDLTWDKAKEHCENLTLLGFSDWRMPTLEELRSAIRGCVVEGQDSEKGCAKGEGPTNGCYWPAEFSGTCQEYWTSTDVKVANAPVPWRVDFRDAKYRGILSGWPSDNLRPVRCVRGGH